MKTIALILLASCLSLWGQNTDTNFVVDTAMRDEILRRAVEQYPTSNQPPAGVNTPTPAVATTPPAATPAALPVSPVAAVSQNSPSNIPAANPSTSAIVPVFPANPPAAVSQAAPVGTLPPNSSPTPRLPGSRLVPAATTAQTTPAAAPAVVPAAPPAVAPAAVPAVVPVVDAPVKPQEPADKVIDFPSIDLNTFLGVYSQEVGRTLLHGQLPNATISLRTQKPLTKTEFIQAMDTVLAMNNITMVNQGDNFVQVLQTGDADKAGGRFTTNRADDIPESMQYMNQIVQLKYTKPTEMAQLLQPFAKIPNSIYPVDSSSMLIIRDYAANVKRMMELIQKVDIIAPTEYEQEIIPIKYAQVSDIASALGTLGAGTGASIGTSRSVGGGVGGGVGTRGGLSGTGGYSPNGVGGIGGQPGGTPFGGATGAGGIGGRGSVAPGLAQRLQGIAAAVGRGGGGPGDIQLFTGATKIVPDERSHSLLVLAGHQDMEMIKSLVKKLDVVLQQVLIEAVIMEVNLDDELNLGVSYLQTSPSQGNYLSGIGALNNGTFLNNGSFTGSGSNGIASLPGGFSYLTHFGGDFDATVTAVATDSRINVLSKPQIQTSDGVPASFKVGDTIPYVTGTYFGGINGQASSQYQQTFVGIDLEVKPQINSEGLVVMDISQDIQQLGPSTQIDGNAVPTTTQRSAASTVSVKDGDTIILGGFVSTTTSKGHSGVPVLKDIPVLGYLFRNESDSKKRVELIVLIRPKVLPTPEAASLVAARERNNMPGLKAADREAQIDENKRLKAADKIVVPNERQ